MRTNRYRASLKLMELRGSCIPAVLNPWLASFPMVVEWPNGQQEYKFSLVKLGAN